MGLEINWLLSYRLKIHEIFQPKILKWKEQLQNTEVDGRTKKKESEDKKPINLCVTSSIRSEADKNFVLLVYYAACIDVSGQPIGPNFQGSRIYMTL